MERNIEKQFMTKDAMKFYQSIKRLSDEQEIALFLRDVLTMEELEEAINRYKVAQLLKEGVTFRKIIEQTGVSSATIARVNNWLHHGCGGYQLALKDTLKIF